MKRLSLVLPVVVSLSASSALARDTKYLLPIAEVVNGPQAQGKLDAEVHLYFGKQEAPEGEGRGEVVVNPKTNAANKDDQTACRWVMLTALIELQQKAKNLGANAVVGIESYYKKAAFSSETEYECHAGAVMAGVALRARLVKTK
jgi:hypothetical protein